mmetsp:Transcript_23098/g.32275  ORF Transcript_23098/g.32275 Transcript_23098/m.32275 type:complete len:86 (+) Transcript_23098:167-424(+)
MRRRGFNVAIVPKSSLHEDYQRSGCVVHLLKMRKKMEKEEKKEKERAKKEKHKSGLTDDGPRSRKRKSLINADELRIKKSKKVPK